MSIAIRTIEIEIEYELLGLLDDLEEPARALALARALAKQGERALLGLVPLCRQVLEGLAPSGLLAAANNASVLVVHKVLLVQATGGVFCCAVENLGLGSNCRNVRGHSYTRGSYFIWCCGGVVGWWGGWVEDKT